MGGRLGWAHFAVSMEALAWLEGPGQASGFIADGNMEIATNQPDRANRRQPLGFLEPVGKVGASGFMAAVAHPGR